MLKLSAACLASSGHLTLLSGATSPMQTATVQEFADGVPDFNLNLDCNTQGTNMSPYLTLFEYKEARLTAAAPACKQGWLVPRATAAALTSGRGYSAQTTPSTVVNISGTLASADVSYSLTRGPLAGAGCNPFPSLLDWDLVPRPMTSTGRCTCTCRRAPTPAPIAPI